MWIFIGENIIGSRCSLVETVENEVKVVGASVLVEINPLVDIIDIIAEILGIIPTKMSSSTAAAALPDRCRHHFRGMLPTVLLKGIREEGVAVLLLMGSKGQ